MARHKRLSLRPSKPKRLSRGLNGKNEKTSICQSRRLCGGAEKGIDTTPYFRSLIMGHFGHGPFWLQGLALGGKSLGGLLKRGGGNNGKTGTSVAESSKGTRNGRTIAAGVSSPASDDQARLAITSAGPSHSNMLQASGSPCGGGVFKW